MLLLLEEISVAVSQLAQSLISISKIVTWNTIFVTKNKGLPSYGFFFGENLLCWSAVKISPVP